jgi:N-acetylglucosaminyldiphosphoundecaprenol N-acetyl-beta-D-mannosaminyltransferase
MHGDASSLVAPRDTLPTVNVLGVEISKLGLNEFLVRVGEIAASGEKAVVQYANIHTLNMACQDKWLREFYNTCEIVFCDGFGVKLAASFLGSPIPERFTSPDWMPLLAEQCERAGRSLFFLGGKGGVGEMAAQVLQRKSPRLRVSGIHHGYFDKRKEDGENSEIIQLINQAHPDVLFVGFGTPMQERWVAENLHELRVGIIVVVGAMFDYLSGSVPRGPRWMTDHGLEWLSRLAIEPRRLWKRYLIGIPVFFVRVLKQRLGLLSPRP